MDMTFIDKCISGDAFLDEVDDYIDAWHDTDIPEDIELHEYLGMTWKEYSLWVTNPSILGVIVDARRKDSSLEDLPSQEVKALAARASSQEEAQRVMNWLKKLGKSNDT
jgi:hypothetical protein